MPDEAHDIDFAAAQSRLAAIKVHDALVAFTPDDKIHAMALVVALATAGMFIPDELFDELIDMMREMRREFTDIWREKMPHA
jgi:energy-converting hydrogenase Eha subunit H